MSWLGFHFGQLQQDPLSNRINFGQNKLNILPNSKEAIKISQRVVKFNQSGDFFSNLVTLIIGMIQATTNTKAIRSSIIIIKELVEDNDQTKKL